MKPTNGKPKNTKEENKKDDELNLDERRAENRKTKSHTLILTRTAIIAAMYAALTFAVYPAAYGAIQFRLSEMLTILPLFYVEAIPGLTIGCLIVNIFSGPWDMLFGTLATLLAALATYFLRKIYLGVWPPIIINALLVPVIFLFYPESFPAPYWLNVLTVGAGQAGAVLVAGIPFYFGLKKMRDKLPLLR